MRSQSPTTMSGSCHVTESLETLSGATNASHDETTLSQPFWSVKAEEDLSGMPSEGQGGSTCDEGRD